MSLQYEEYLSRHIGDVNRGLHWMLDNLPLSQEEISAIEDAMLHEHDASKYSIEEYGPYDEYFYGNKNAENRSAVEEAFDYAWLHHIHNNPHHWQYWVLLEDDPVTFAPFKALRIPLPYIFEMIADWWTFSWRAGNLFEIFKWYGEHRDKQYIHPESRKIIERILEKIWDVLIMQETVAGHDISEIEGQYRRFWIEQKDVKDVIYKMVELGHPNVLTTREIESMLEHKDEEDEDLYGIQELKKFPMPDKKHVKSAIRFFNYVDPKHEKELAEAILEKAEEFGLIFGEDMEVGEDNRFRKYLQEKKEES